MTKIEGWVPADQDLQGMTDAILTNLKEELLSGSVAEYRHINRSSDCVKIEISVTITKIEN